MTLSKETGYGWSVVAASFLVHFIVGGLAYSGGVWQLIFIDYFESTQYDTAWLCAILLSLTALGGIPSTLLSFQFGYRVSVLCGAVLTATGLTLALFATELQELYLSLGVITGLGLGLVLTPSVMVLGGYFSEQLYFASSVAATGSSLGVVFIPVLLYHLEELFAWKGALLLLLGLAVHLLACAALIKDPAAAQRSSALRRRRRLLNIFNPSLFKSGAFDALLLSNMLWSAGAAVVLVHVPGYALRTGLSRDDAVMLLGVIGVTNFVSRVIFQLFSHSAKLDATSNFLCSAGLAGIVTFLFPEFFKHKAGEIGYCIMFGLHCGYWSTFVASVAGELLSDELIASGRGYLSLSVGLGYALGPPTAGWIIDQHPTSGFKIVFYSAGACLLLSSLVMLAVSLKKCYYRPAVDVNAGDSNSSIGSKVSGPAPSVSAPPSSAPPPTLGPAHPAATAAADIDCASEQRSVTTTLLTAV